MRFLARLSFAFLLLFILDSFSSVIIRDTTAAYIVCTQNTAAFVIHTSNIVNIDVCLFQQKCIIIYRIIYFIVFCNMFYEKIIIITP